MGKIIYGTELNNEITNIIKNSENQLVIISPYIKLHSRLKDELNSKQNKEKLKIKVLFGKNEGDASKSLTMDDLNFFREFPNIIIN